MRNLFLCGRASPTNLTILPLARLIVVALMAQNSPQPLPALPTSARLIVALVAHNSPQLLLASTKTSCPLMRSSLRGTMQRHLRGKEWGRKASSLGGYVSLSISAFIQFFGSWCNLRRPTTRSPAPPTTSSPAPKHDHPTWYGLARLGTRPDEDS